LKRRDRRKRMRKKRERLEAASSPGSVAAPEMCQECAGKGVLVTSASYVTCPRCKGTGKYSEAPGNGDAT
jgi:DnaJ-class molecular chaperone